MAISVNYATPVYVNGFICRNCTDVDYAKKHIDPAHPKDGPYGIDAKTAAKPTVGSAAAGSYASATSSSATPSVGGQVNLLV